MITIKVKAVLEILASKGAKEALIYVHFHSSL